MSTMPNHENVFFAELDRQSRQLHFQLKLEELWPTFNRLSLEVDQGQKANNAAQVRVDVRFTELGIALAALGRREDEVDE